MDNGEYAPFHDRFSAPALWSQLTPAIPYQRPRQPYPERISYTCRSGEFFIVAIRPAIRAFEFGRACYLQGATEDHGGLFAGPARTQAHAPSPFGIMIG